MQILKTLHAGTVLAAFATVTPFVAADEPATQPATRPAVPPATQPVADAGDVKDIHDLMVGWDNSVAKMSLQDVRKCFYTENDREAVYWDRIAHEAWETGKAQQAVRDKWGPADEAKFSHLLQATTAEDDATAKVKIDHDHATVSWDITGVEPQPMIKVDGKWLVDGHAMFQKNLALYEDFDKTSDPSTMKIIKQAIGDISSDKFDDFDSFFSDFSAKIKTPAQEN